MDGSEKTQPFINRALTQHRKKLCFLTEATLAACSLPKSCYVNTIACEIQQLGDENRIARDKIGDCMLVFEINSPADVHLHQYSIEKNQEELEAFMLQSCDIVVTMEMWWDDSQDLSVGMDGYKLFRRVR